MQKPRKIAKKKRKSNALPTSLPTKQKPHAIENFTYIASLDSESDQSSEKEFQLKLHQNSLRQDDADFTATSLV